MPDPTDAEIQTGADAIAQSWRVLSPTSRRHLAKLVLVAVLPDHDARVRADERAKVAQEIHQHADRHAPAGHPLNHPRTVLRRHLLLAARIADGPLTDDDLAHIAAQVVGLARQHREETTDA